MKYSDLPKAPRNPAHPPAGFQWPADHKSALFLSFDFDAETAWFHADADYWHSQVRLSHGGYGARVGVPKILDLLAELGLKATFFVPGWTVEAHAEVCMAILGQGHEIGHHGYYHTLPDPAQMQQSMDELEKGFDAFDRVLGIKPDGYRAPLGENNDVFLTYLAERGVRYSSSWRDDILPYRHVIEGVAKGPVELPANYFFDDWMHGMIKGSGRNLVAREEVLSMWRDELEVTHEWGGLVTTVFHPQVSGRPSRYKTLREFLQGAMAMGDVWITTGQDICGHFETLEAAQ